jgi:hypothetical protein
LPLLFLSSAAKQLAELIKRQFTAEEQARFLITWGWYYPNATTLKYELEYAVKRTKIDLRHMEFVFEGDDDSERIQIARRLHASFDESMKLENRCDQFDPSWPLKLEQGIVPGHLLVNGLLSECVQSINSGAPPYMKYALAVGVMHGLIPSIIRLASDPSATFGRSAPEVCIIVMCFCVSFFNVFANLAFVLTGKVDFDRRVYLMHQCSAMLSVQYKIHQSGKSQLLPLLNVDAAKNIASWLDLRLLLKDFGQQYSHRIQAYASLWLFFVILFLAYLFSQLVIQRSELTSIVLVVFDLVVLMASLVMMILSAKTLNTVHLEHRRILLHQLNLLQRQISHAVSLSPTGLELDLSPPRIKQLRETKEMIEVALQVLDHEDAVSRHNVELLLSHSVSRVADSFSSLRCLCLLRSLRFAFSVSTRPRTSSASSSVSPDRLVSPRSSSSSTSERFIKAVERVRPSSDADFRPVAACICSTALPPSSQPCRTFNVSRGRGRPHLRDPARDASNQGCTDAQYPPGARLPYSKTPSGESREDHSKMKQHQQARAFVALP